MSRVYQWGLLAMLAVGAWRGTEVEAAAQALPNPDRAVDGWAKLPDGRKMGAVGGVTMDPDGNHLWAVVRCYQMDPDRFGNECLDSEIDPILKFDLEGNVWVTDAVSPERTPPGTRGHQVIQFSPAGEVLMTLGTPGVPGSGPDRFLSPSDVVVADNGDIFVADGHADEGNNRVVKYSKDGRFIKTWGKTGYGPGEFRTLHAIAIDSRGRVFVADRSNNRIQIFDQDGNFLAVSTQFGRPSGIFFEENDRIYVSDSESDDVQNPGWEMGIRMGDARTGWVDGFILYPWGDPREVAGNGAEFVAVDRHGNIYGAEPRPKNLQKYVRVRP